MYFAILLFVSLFFSYNWYSVATSELNRALLRQQEFFQQRPQELSNQRALEIAERLEEQVREGKRIIALKIIYSNIIMVGLGAIGSYYLARRTLGPIESAHEARIRFTADASHELRTPLAAMQSEIEVTLRDKKSTRKDIEKLLHSNLEELSKLSKLSDSLLKLARQDTKDTLDFEVIEMNELIKEVISRVGKLAKLKKITIKADLDPAKGYINRESMEELLVILLDNAIKYSPDKSEIKVEGKVQKKQYRIKVIDQGVGIKETEQVHIFDRFYRADNSRTKQKTKGHGLGLSIAQNIAKVHGSKIKVMSKPGEGSTFSLYLDTVKS